MKTLSGALSAALGAPVQQPALLVEAAFATTRRWSSFATLTWSGRSWSREDVGVEDLEVQPLRVSGSLVFGNADGAIGSLILAEGVQDRVFRLWGYDAAATAAGDVVWLCEAVGASAQVTEQVARIALRHRSEFTAAPRIYVNQAAGFNTLQPAGAVLRINGQDLRLQRRD